jgi:uncharacterized protein
MGSVKIQSAMIVPTKSTINLERISWNDVHDGLNARGYQIVPDLLDAHECQQLIALYDESNLFRKTVSMERYRFGRGEYKYFRYPLTEIIQSLRENVYTALVPVANAWMKNLNSSIEYPPAHADFIARCMEAGQQKPTVLVLRYGEGGFNTLHQDLYGDVYFPFQIVLFLNQRNEDFSGGEFVLTEQIPRAQSKAIVLLPPRGSMLIFTTNFRPVRGSRGFYRVNMKHGVSEVLHGKRHTLGIIFHDAVS